MRIGIFGGETGQGAGGMDELVEARQRDASDQGFASYWLPQIFGVDALTALAVVGREVPDIELGTSVIPTYPRHPMMLAGQALTVAERDRRPPRARHRAVAPDRDRVDVGLLVRQARAAHEGVPVDPAPAALRRAGVVPGRDRSRPTARCTVDADVRRAADPRRRARHADAATSPGGWPTARSRG